MSRKLPFPRARERAETSMSCRIQGLAPCGVDSQLGSLDHQGPPWVLAPFFSLLRSLTQTGWDLPRWIKRPDISLKFACCKSLWKNFRQPKQQRAYIETPKADRALDLALYHDDA